MKTGYELSGIELGKDEHGLWKLDCNDEITVVQNILLINDNYQLCQWKPYICTFSYALLSANKNRSLRLFTLDEVHRHCPTCRLLRFQDVSAKDTSHYCQIYREGPPSHQDPWHLKVFIILSPSAYLIFLKVAFLAIVYGLKTKKGTRGIYCSRCWSSPLLRVLWSSRMPPGIPQPCMLSMCPGLFPSVNHPRGPRRRSQAISEDKCSTADYSKARDKSWSNYIMKYAHILLAWTNQVFFKIHSFRKTP